MRKSSFHHLSIGQRIGLALAFPVVALVALSLWSAADRYQALVDNQRALELVGFATAANGLVQALQLERGTAIGFVSSGESLFRDEVPQRQQETDRARAVFSVTARDLNLRAFDQALDQQATATGRLVEDVESWRDELRRRAVSPSDLLARYGSLVEKLIGLTRQLLLAHQMEGDVARILGAYIRVMQAKEYAGLERAVGSMGFSARRFEAADLARMVELSERQNLYLDEFRLYADAATARELDQGWTMRDAAELSAMRQMALSSLGGRPIGQGDAARWFELTSKRIDLMRRSESNLADGLIRQARQGVREALLAAAWGGLLAAVALTATLLVARRLARDIIVPLHQVTLGMTRLAHGDQGVEFEPAEHSDEIGDMMRAMLVFRRNLTAVVHAQAQITSQAILRQKERYQRALLDNFPFHVWLKDVDGRYLAVNRSLADSMGLSGPEAAVGRTDAQLRDPLQAAALRRVDQQVMHSRQTSVVEQLVPGTGQEAPRWLEIYNAPMPGDDGAVLGTVGFARDISESKQAQEEIRQLALYDALTQLPNRRLLRERLALAIMQARRDQKRLALLFIDLDGFKPVNDKLGHAVGDLLLQAAARRMHDCVREADTVARIGGDEFVVLLNRIDHQDDALAVAEKVRHSLNQPFELDGGHVVSISSSAGVAVFPDHGADEPTLSEHADRAMYQAKAQGRNRVVLFAPERAPDPPKAA